MLAGIAGIADGVNFHADGLDVVRDDGTEVEGVAGVGGGDFVISEDAIDDGGGESALRFVSRGHEVHGGLVHAAEVIDEAGGEGVSGFKARAAVGADHLHAEEHGAGDPCEVVGGSDALGSESGAAGIAVGHLEQGDGGIVPPGDLVGIAGDKAAVGDHVRRSAGHGGFADEHWREEVEVRRIRADHRAVGHGEGADLRDGSGRAGDDDRNINDAGGDIHAIGTAGREADDGTGIGGPRIADVSAADVEVGGEVIAGAAGDGVAGGSQRGPGGGDGEVGGGPGASVVHGGAGDDVRAGIESADGHAGDVRGQAIGAGTGESSRGRDVPPRADGTGTGHGQREVDRVVERIRAVHAGQAADTGDRGVDGGVHLGERQFQVINAQQAVCAGVIHIGEAKTKELAG